MTDNNRYGYDDDYRLDDCDDQSKISPRQVEADDDALALVEFYPDSAAISTGLSTAVTKEEEQHQGDPLLTEMYIEGYRAGTASRGSGSEWSNYWKGIFSGAIVASLLGDSLPKGARFVSRELFDSAVTALVRVVTGDFSHTFRSSSRLDTLVPGLTDTLLSGILIDRKTELRDKEAAYKSGAMSWIERLLKRGQRSSNSSDSRKSGSSCCKHRHAGDGSSWP